MNKSCSSFKLLRDAILSVCFLVLAGCGDSGTDNNENSASFTSLWAERFIDCGLICHNSSSSNGTELGLQITDKDQFYSDITTKRGSDYINWIKISDCNNTPYVTGSDPERSLLLASLDDGYSIKLKSLEGCVSTSYNYHDINNIYLADDVKDNLINWINDGAKNN